MHYIITVTAVTALAAVAAKVIINSNKNNNSLSSFPQRQSIIRWTQVDSHCGAFWGPSVINLCGPSYRSLCEVKAALVLISRLKVKKGAISQLSFQACGVIVLLAASHAALVVAGSVCPQQPQPPCFHTGWEGQKNQLAIWDVNKSQVQMQLKKHFSERLMYLWKTVGHLYCFQRCLCLLLLPEKANVLTLHSNSLLAAVHQTGIAKLGVIHIKSTKISWDGILESATIYSMMCRSNNALTPGWETSMTQLKLYS